MNVDIASLPRSCYPNEPKLVRPWGRVSRAGSRLALLFRRLGGFRRGNLMGFNIDLEGRIDKIRLGAANSLQALFEAVANAAEAVDADGRVTIRVLRDTATPVMQTRTERIGRPALAGFEVQDNGVGFDPTNYDSFIHSDSRHKSARGGKGIGRLLWLKVFRTAEIDSVYHTPTGARRRRFRFSLSDKGVGDDSSDQPVADKDAPPRGTTVRLTSPLPGREGHLDMDAERLASRLVEYFFLYFSVFAGVRFDLVDAQDGDRIDLNARYAETVADRHVEEVLEVKGRSFTLHHLFVAPAGRRNAVHLCAHGRVVTARNLSELLGEVEAQQNVASDGNLRYHAYVTGEYLDEIVDDERTGLRFPEESLYETADPLRRGDLDDALKPRIRAHLHTHLEAIRKRKEQELDNFTANEQPQFRPFLDLAKRRLDRLPAKASKRDIELALYEAKIDSREELNELVRQLADERPVLGRVDGTLAHLMAKFAATANRSNMSALAEYVCARRAVLSVFEGALGRKDDGTKHYEAVVHDLFLPRLATSAYVPIGPTDPDLRRLDNLWLIDERLAFSSLVASDLPAGSHKAVPTDASEEPDILIFNRIHTFAETGSGPPPFLALVEFKRPGRTDYSLAESPVQQIINVIKKIRQGKFEDGSGRHRGDWKNLVIYGYAVCDFTESFRDMCVWQHRMFPTPDGEGFYTFDTDQKYIIEAISYSKILNDANKRNAAFFQKLGM